jgi:phosphoribosyl 1,2-cyclic phosphodiesterase/ActR/RegA family two-component response regulator
MQNKLHFLFLDTDAVTFETCKALLEAAGHTLTQDTLDSTAAAVIALKPDCIICDISASETRSLALLAEIRNIPAITQPVFLILTDRKNVIDYERIFSLGVNGYLSKPINPNEFVTNTMAAYTGDMIVHCWGARGTLPVPGIETTRYGGNTNCVTLRIADNHFFIFDGGTGLKALSNHLLREKKFPMSAKIFFSHPHYDHINGVPFFVPFYMKGNEFEVFGMRHSNIGIEELISGQMDTVYFPITIKEFGATLKFHELTVETIYIDDIQIKTTILNHPGKAMGFRVQYRDKTFCYVTDNELYFEDSTEYHQSDIDRLVDFVKNTDVLFIDATYTDADYAKKVGWGHSCISRVVDVADKAQVKLLYLHHHDPDQTDQDIDDKLAFAKQLLAARHSKTQCMAAKEGENFTITHY